MLTGTLSACADDKIVIEVTSIEIDTLPTQKYFLVGAELNIDDTVLYVTYENGFSRTVTLADIKEDVTITGYDNTKRGLNQNVTLTYRGKSVSMVIDVVNESDVLKMSFDQNNGTLLSAPLTAIADKPLGAYISESQLTPTYEGYVFGGWYTSSDNGVTLDRRVDFSTDTFTQNTVFYAKWQVAVIFHLANYTADNVYEITSSYTAYVDKGGDMSEADFTSYVDNRLMFRDKQGYTRAYKYSDVTVAGMDRADVLKLEDASYGAGYTNITEAKTVYCVYVADLIKLYFDFNGATSTWDANYGFSALKTEEVEGETLYYDEMPYGTKYVFGDPMKTATVGEDDYVFKFGGWYTAEDYADANKVVTHKVTGGYSSLQYTTDPITASTTIYARWRWELLLYSGVMGALLEPLETLTFDEDEVVYYHDLPEVPVTFMTSNSEEPVSYPRDKYTSWWAVQENLYSDGSTSNFTEYEYALDPSRAYTLGDLLSDKILGNVAVVYANYYRIPYYVTFNTYNQVTQTDPTIVNGDQRYFGEVLSSYNGANGSSSKFEGWYTDKYLSTPLVSGVTTVSGNHYGRSNAYVTDGEGLIILNSRTYYVEKTEGTSNIYSTSFRYLTTEEKVDFLVGTYLEDGRFSIDGAKYYALGTAVYVLDASGDVTVGEETYALKADFDENKAYAKSSYGIMDLHAAYTVEVNFRIASTYPGSDTFNALETSNLTVRMEYFSDGVYYASVVGKIPALPTQTGLNGYWLHGNAFGIVDTDSYDQTTQIPTKYPKFDKIAGDVSFAAHYITQQFEVKYILNNQKDDADFSAVYEVHKDMLDETYTAKITYNQKASFYKEDEVIAEGDLTTGIVKWQIEGWYTEPDYLSKFDFANTAIIMAHTLYAKWVRVGTVGLEYTLLADDTYRVSGFDQTAFEGEYGSGATLIRLVVPDYYQGKHVTQIGGSVFKNNSTLKEIFVAHSVTKIDAEAFFNATALEQLNTFNQNVQLGDNVFGNTKWYVDAKSAAADGMIIFNQNQLYEYFGTAKDVTITEESGIKIIGYGAFIGNKTIETLRISNQVSAIRGYAFALCSNLKSIEFFASDHYAYSQLAASSIGTAAFMQLESLASITLLGDNYATQDGVLYRRVGGANVELILYPTCKQGDILVLPKSLTAIGQHAFYSSSNMIGLKAIVFDSLTAPTLGAGSNAFANLPNLQYILVSESPTYRGEDYNNAWLDIYNNATYRDKFRYNNIAVDYVSSGIPLTNVADKLTFVYGDEAEDYVPTTNNVATFVGWFVDEGLTDRWTGSLEDWLVVWDILDTLGWDADGRTTGVLRLYAKWEVAINTGSSNAGTVYVIGGKPVEDDRIVLTIDGVKYYASYQADGTVTFDDQAPIGTFTVDVAAKTLTRIITETSETLTYTFGRIAINVSGKTYYLSVNTSGDVTFSGSKPSGTWTIDQDAQVVSRTEDGVVTRYRYQGTPISVVVDKARYYASYDQYGVVTFEGSAPVGIFSVDVTTGVLTRLVREQEVYTFGQKAVVVGGEKSYITVEERSYTVGVETSKRYLTANGGIVTFEGIAPTGVWSIDGTSLTRTVDGVSIVYTVEEGYIRFALDNVTYYAKALGTPTDMTLGNLVFDGQKPDGVFNLDSTTNTLTRTLDGVSSTLIYSRGYYLVYIDEVVFTADQPTGKWYIDHANKTLIRIIGQSRTDFSYLAYTAGETPVTFVDGGVTYYATVDSLGRLNYAGNAVVPNASFMAIADLNLVGKVVAHDKVIKVIVDGTAYYATIDGTAVTFNGAAPSGTFTADTGAKTLFDGTTTYPYIEGLLVDGKFAVYDTLGYLTFDAELGTSTKYHYSVALDFVIERVASAFGVIELLLDYVDLSNNNSAGVWAIDYVNKTVTLTHANGTSTYAYVEEPILLSNDGVRVGNINVYSYLSGVVAQRENVEEGYTTAWFYLDGERVTDEYVDLNNVVKGGSVTVDRRINVYDVTYKYYDHDAQEWVVYYETTAEHFSTLLRPENPTHPSVDGVELLFGGWYLDEEARVNRWQDNAEVTADIILYARWTVRIATMYYVNGDDTDPVLGSDVLALYDGTMTAPQAQNKPGYTYKWYLKEGDVFTEFDFSTKIVKNYTLYARYEELVYTVHFETEQGTAPDDQEVKYGDYASYVTVTDGLEGYVFVGWYLDREFSNAFGFVSTPVERNLTLYACWVYTTTTSLLYNVVATGATTTYSVMGKNIQDSVVYIPEKVFRSVDTYKIYKESDLSGDALPNSTFERANNAITIIDETLQALVQASVFYKDTEGYVYLGQSFSAAGKVGTYTENSDGSIATVTITGTSGDPDQALVYYIDLSNATPEIVSINNSQVTTIETSAFENNTKISHIVISQYVRDIRSNAFNGMTNLARFTVLSDGKVYYDVNGRQLVNCNGYYASIDGVLYAVSTSMQKEYNGGIMVSVDRLIKMPPKLNIESYTVEKLKFSLDNGSVLIDEAGPSIDGYAFEGLEYLEKIDFEATTRPTLGDYVFSDVKTELKIFVTSKQGFIYTDGTKETAWYEWRDYLYPNVVEVTYVHTMTGDVLYTEYVDVFDVASDLSYTEQYVDGDGRRWNFGGWTTDESMVKPYDFTKGLEEDVTLYARWVVTASSGLQYDKILYAGEEAYMVSYIDTPNKNIVIPNFYMGLPVRKIGFFRSANIETMYIPATVMDIPETSLLNLTSLVSVTVDAKSTYFKTVDGVLFSFDGEDLVLYPANLNSSTTEYVVPQGTVNVKRGAFYGTSLTKITFAESVTSIGQALFGNTVYLDRIIFMSTTPATLRANPFVGASSNLLILVPGVTDGVNIVDRYKEGWADMTEDVYLDNIFAKTVYLRLMVETDNTWTVFSSPSTEYASVVGTQSSYPTADGKVFVGWYTTEYSGGRIWDFVNDKLYQDTYLYARWNMSTGSDENGTPYLNYNSGRVSLNRDAIGALDLEKIVISSHYVYDGITYTVDTIDEEAFKDMTKLKTVVIPSTVKTILKDAFMGCHSLVDISLPASILVIGEGAFSDCTALESIVIPSAVGTLSNRLFDGCVSLKSVLLTGSPSIIGEGAFRGCIALENVDIKDAVTSIGDYAFEGASVLASIVLPATLTHIGNYVFKDCVLLETVTFAEGIVLDTGLGEGLFYNCYQLDGVVLPQGLTSIPNMVFYYNTSLTSIFIPKTITSIEVRAFYQCTSLVEVDIEDGSLLATFGASSFANNTSLVRIEIPSERKVTFGQNAFTGCIALKQVILHSLEVAVLQGSDTTQMFLYGADNATLYVDADLVPSYKNGVVIYSDRVKPYYSKVSYMIDNKTPYQHLVGNTPTQYVFDNLTDNLVADENVLDAPVTVQTGNGWGWNKDGLTFGGWGYYKNATDTTLSIFNFATQVVGEEGIVLYAIWIVDGTDGLAYTLTHDGTIQVSRGNISTETELVIGNYYKYNNVYLPVTRIQSNLISGTSVEIVKIPETILTIADDAFVNCPTLKKFVVDSNNTAYKVEDDVLYTYDKKKVVSYPPSKGQEVGSVTFHIPYETTTITPYTFENAMYIEQFYNNSAYFMAKEYVLYTADGKSLVAYPALRGNVDFMLPKEVESIYVNAFSLSPNSSLMSITVEEGNTKYFAEDGILYRTVNATTAELIRYPVAKEGDATGKYALDVTRVVRIATNAFRYVKTLTAVVFNTATPIPLGNNVFSDMGTGCYLLVPTDSVYSYKVTSGWVGYSDKILPIKSVVTFNPNNGDDSLTVEVDTLDAYPLYPYDDPILPYSTPSDWYYLDSDNTPVDVVLGSTDCLVFGDVEIMLAWTVENGTAGLTFTQSGEGYLVSKGSASTSQDNRVIVIPSYYNGMPVIGIAEDGFRVTDVDKAMQNLRTIVIPETVKSIGDGAFTGCLELTDMVLLTIDAPSVSDKTVLSDWRSAVYSNGNIPMHFLVRQDAFKNFDSDSDWPNAVRTFSMRVNVLDGIGGNLIASHVLYKLYDSANIINPDLSSIDTTKEGYDFVGWYYTNAQIEYEYTQGGQQLDVTEVRRSGVADFSLTIYAKYTPKTITLTFTDLMGSITEQEFDADQNPIPVTRTALTGESITPPETVLNGAEFFGWIDVATGEYVDLTQGMPTRDMTLRADWKYYSDVTFDVNDGSIVEDGRYYRDQLLPTPQREGYVFGGWVLAEDADGNPIGTPVFNVDATFGTAETLYAVWVAEQQA